MMCVMTMARAAGVHSIDSYAVLGEYCEESTMAVRVVGCFPTTNDLYGDHCRHWWWLEPIVCTHLAVGASCRCLFSGRGWLLTHSVVTARARTKTKANFRDNGIYVCWLCKHTPMATDSMGMHTAVEANDKSCAKVCKFHRGKGCR